MLPAALLPVLACESATFAATSAADSGTGSLRQLITSSAEGSTITFAINVSGTTITLTNGQFNLGNKVTVDASTRPGGTQMNGHGTSRTRPLNRYGTKLILISLQNKDAELDTTLS